MDLRNTNPINLKNNNEDYELQIVDWYDYNEDCNDSDSETEEEYNNKKFVIRIFGVDKDNNSVSVKVKNFKPRFYLNIPNSYDTNKVKILINEIKNKVKKRYREALTKFLVVKKKKFRGFTNNEKLKFIKFVFNDSQSMYQYIKVCERKIRNTLLHKKPKKYDLYESNIPTFLRFCHIKDIKTAGWIKLPKNKYNIIKNRETYCQKELEIEWNSIEKSELTHISPLVVLSFDIECDSSHGDFPLAKKSYKKLANEMVDYIYRKKLYKLDDSEKLKIMDKLLLLAFKKEKNDDISYCFTKNNIKPDEKSIEILKDKLLNILFIKIERVVNNKDLRQAVSRTKEIWTLEQSLDLLISICKDMGKEYSLDYKTIFKKILTRDILIEKITEILNVYLPELEGDNVIQIGSTVHKYGDSKCYLKHIVTLKSCNPIDNTIVVSCKNEKNVLIEWCKFVRELDPDIITGYNIFGFDYKFIFERAGELDCLYEMNTISRLKNKNVELIEKNLSSSALGENVLTYLNTEGRVSLDLLKIIQKDHKLNSYKLDTVSENFINNSIISIENNKLEIKGSNDLEKGNYITIFFKNDKYLDGKKFQIINKENNTIYLDSNIENIIIECPKWRLAKDDIGPKDIFRLQNESKEGRTIVAKYCIQDCQLCNKLIMKLNIIANNIGMANVCSVPLSFIFLRGQGIKIFSLVAKECRENDFLIPVLKKPKNKDDIKKPMSKFKYYDDDDSSSEEEMGGYEGAIVLKPNPGIYFEPITVLDYSSLYPSCMISENLSHDTIILEEKYDNLQGYDYIDITYDVYEWINIDIKSKGKKKTGQKTCRFVQFKDGSKGIIPQILQKLLKQRKYVRKEMIYKTIEYPDGKFSGLISNKDDLVIIKNLEGEHIEINKKDIIKEYDTYNEFEKEVKEGLQLAYKVTANSLYGQIGAKTSAICLIDIAASTTATGRKLLYLAQEKTEEKFEGAEVVYGDTDSIFINFNPTNDEGVKLYDKMALKRSIELGVEAEKYIQTFLKIPHKLEYEKTFYPFILFTKKRYIGNKYEFDLDKYKQTSMGIVLKRRDNAEIVKHVYGGIMNIIMREKNINKSIKFLNKELIKLVKGKFPMEMLTITKCLKSYYKNPETIAHKVLADRIGEREPGNKPLPNDRIPYIYIENNNKNILQGDKIEIPSFITENKLKPDYMFYITNQIKKPVCQIYGLIVEQLENYNFDNEYMIRLNTSYKTKYGDKYQEKITEKRNKIAGEILFQNIERICNNKKNKIKPITHWFK